MDVGANFNSLLTPCASHLCGCVIGPEIPLSPERFVAAGLPHSDSDRVAVFVSSVAAPLREQSGDKPENFGTSQSSAIAQAFGEGFHAHLPTFLLQATGEDVIAGCVERATGPSGLDVESAVIDYNCRALSGFRYVVLPGGARRTSYRSHAGAKPPDAPTSD